jgi:formate-dependent nitrite reductase cytochrome c552 subunit
MVAAGRLWRDTVEEGMRVKLPIRHRGKLAFTITFSVCLGLGALSAPAMASGVVAPPAQRGEYAGPDVCAACHEEIHDEWRVTRHAQAFSSPIFQQNWEEIGGEFTCLSCHTTGYDPAINSYASEGVTCEACHGPMQEGHPVESMPIKADAELCSTCHKTTTDEWKASPHGQQNIQCQACHDPHAQRPKAETVTGLCSNCHKERGDSFTHGTHADAGLECSNCHMFTDPRVDPPVEGLIATGHTFSVGSQACVGCHQDTVHTRNTIISLSGEVQELVELNPDDLRLQVHEQAETISELEARSDTRLYVGLAQGGIIGLATGAMAAWVVSRSLRVVEIEDDEDGQADQS